MKGFTHVSQKILSIIMCIGIFFILTYFGVDTIYHMVFTFYDYALEWRSWHQDKWTFANPFGEAIEIPLAPSLTIAFVSIIVGVSATAYLLIWSAHWWVCVNTEKEKEGRLKSSSNHFNR